MPEERRLMPYAEEQEILELTQHYDRVPELGTPEYNALSSNSKPYEPLRWLNPHTEKKG